MSADSESAAGLTERIALVLDTTGVQTGSLKALVTELDLVAQAFQRVNAAAQGGAASYLRNKDTVLQQMKAAALPHVVSGSGKTVGGPSVEAVSKQFNLELNAFKAHLSERTKVYKQWVAEIAGVPAFRSFEAAGAAVVSFAKKQPHPAFEQTLTPRVADVGTLAAPKVSGKGVAASVEGLISLVIPASQVQASVIGQVGAPTPGKSGAVAASPESHLVAGPTLSPAQLISNRDLAEHNLANARQNYLTLQKEAAARIGGDPAAIKAEFKRLEGDLNRALADLAVAEKALATAAGGGRRFPGGERHVVSGGDGYFIRGAEELGKFKTEDEALAAMRQAAGTPPPVRPRDPATGHFLPGGGGGGEGGGGGGRGGGGGKFARTTGRSNVGRMAGEVGRVTTYTDETWKEIITAESAAGATIAKTYNDIGDLIQTQEKTPTGRELARVIRQKGALEAEAYKLEKANLLKKYGNDTKNAGYLRALSALQVKQGAQLTATLTGIGDQQLPGSAAGAVQTLVTARAATWTAQGGATAAYADRLQREAVQKDVNDRFAARRRREMEELRAAKTLADKRFKNDEEQLQRRYGRDVYRTGTPAMAAERADLYAARALPVEERLARSRALPQRMREQYAEDVRGWRNRERDWRNWQAAPPPPPPPSARPSAPQVNPQVARIQSGLAGLSPLGYLGNLVKVSGWALAAIPAYTALQGVMQGVTYSFAKFIDVGLQTQRLDQVFRGVGGSAKELADDVMRLAAANGRATDEALESAIAWSRLGLNRAQVNEAVRVSLVAANVAELTAGEATKALSSILVTYNLNVSELDAALGMLNNTSNKMNVTNKDLLDGLGRSANVAKQAGIGFAELQGLIGATVAKTGQTGAVVGNMIKTVVARLGDPGKQSVLRDAGIEATASGGGLKSGSQVLGELFVKWQSLSDAEKQNLSIKMAGAQQVNRFVAMMDNYVEAQVRAVDAQLNLNSAQQENAKILASLKAQLAGLRSEWDRLVVSQMNAKMSPGGGTIAEGLTSTTRTTRNLVNLASRAGFGMQDVIPSPTATNKLLPLFSNLWQRSLRPLMHAEDKANLRPESGLLDVFNYGLEKLTQSKAAFTFPAELQKVVELRNRSGGLREKGETLETLARALGGANPERQQELLLQAKPFLLQAKPFLGGGPVGEKNFSRVGGFLSGGDTAAAQDVLRDMGKIATGEALDAKIQELSKTKELLTVWQGEKTALEAIPSENRTAPQIEALAKATTATQELGRASRETQRDIEDFIPEQALARKQEYVTLLQEVENAMKGVAEAGRQGGGLGTFTEHLERTRVAAGENIAMLERAKAAVEARPDLAKEPILKHLESQIGAARAEAGAANAPRARWMAGTLDDRGVAFQRAQWAASALGTGVTESEKLLTREAALKREIADLSSRGRLDDNTAARLLTYELELERTRMGIVERTVKLRHEEHQAIVESQREFAKGLLFAGPGQQLKMLAAAQLSKRQLSPGEFMGLDPEMRRYYYEARGGEGAARAREEMGLTGPPEPIEETQKRRRAFWSRGQFNLDANWAAGEAAQPDTTPLTVASERAADRLTAMAAAAMGVTMGLENMMPALNGIARWWEAVGGGGVPGGEAAPIDLNTGNSPGDWSEPAGIRRGSL